MCEDGLGRVVRSGGLAIFAGLIDTQEYGVREALQTQGLTVIDRLQEKDWVCLIARKECTKALHDGCNTKTFVQVRVTFVIDSRIRRQARWGCGSDR